VLSSDRSHWALRGSCLKARIWAAAKQLLNAAKRHGFAFQRIAPGEDGPLWGVRQSVDWVDEI
jgi:hypothetical protein